MALCNCTSTQQPVTIPINSSGVTYDGQATCTGFTEGDLNELIIHLSDLICQIEAEILAIDISSDDVSIESILVDADCLGTVTDLTELLQAIIDKLCLLYTQVQDLDQEDILFSSSIDASCLGLGTWVDAEQAISELLAFLCVYIGSMDIQIPLNPFSVNPMVVNDASVMGQAAIEIENETIWCNNKFYSMGTETINLPNSKDCYVYIDNTTGNYTLISLIIGSPAPTPDGQIVCYVQTGVGVLATVPSTAYIYNKPINGSHIDDDSITADMIAAAALHASLIKIGGLIGVDPEDSLELDAVTGKLQLKNDSAAPGNSKYYGTSSVGTRGYHSLPTSDMNGAGVNVAASGGTINATGNYTSYHITVTDAVDVDTISCNVTDNKLVTISNNSGSGIKFVSGGNLNFDNNISLADGQYTLVLFKAGQVYFITASFTRDMKTTLTAGDQNTYLGYEAGLNDLGINTTVIGYYAGAANAGNGCVGLGKTAINANTGDFVVGIGIGASQNNTGDNCIGIGKNALNGNTEDNKLFIGNSSALGGEGVLYGGYLDTAERIYNYIPGVLDNLIYVIDYTGSFNDDETSSITPKKLLNVGSIDLTVLTGSTLYAAKYSITDSATQVSWEDGAVFETSDLDTYVCVYYDAGVLKIKNRLGALAYIIISMKYQEAIP